MCAKEKYFFWKPSLVVFGVLVTNTGNMDAPNSLPNDVQECQRLLLAAYRQSLVLEQAAEDAKQRAMESEQQAAELTRVLDETAASYKKLQQEHAATLDELAWHKRWAFGRRRERGSEAAGPRAAVLYTILAGAKRHHIEPWSYVRDILLRIHAEDLRLEELLPDRWAAAHPEAILSHRLEESRAKAIRTRAHRAHRRAGRQ